jgi:eukaryotic-like serine/threonine-protein kinase
MDDQAPSLDEIYFSVLERDSPEARASYLDEVCERDPSIRRGVALLLEARSHVGSFLEEPAWVPEPALIAQVADSHAIQAWLTGQTIGRYKLIEEIGEGGMGVVFLAEQTHPMRRQVAIKFIRPGMGHLLVARFEAERQALALMDHPGIARVLDAGTTEQGGPYFVMELVRGIPITEYCDRNRLTIPERLELFVCVCQSVQHAHQKQIVHRDLKPPHVLIALHEGVPVPKIIDFGIAKITTCPGSNDKTVPTTSSQLVGTPLYMSPEQAMAGSEGIDARSDIYALGVMLYELLTGRTPIDQERLRDAGYEKLLRVICKEVPPGPSARILALGAAAEAVASKFQTTPGGLRRML